MNENIENMCKELKREFPEDFGSYLGVDAIDRKDRYDNDEFFDEIRIYYKEQTITIERYYANNWVIEDEDYIKFEDFREIGKILSIVMKHISRIELI